MRLIPLAAICPDTLMPLSPNQLARREQIRAEQERVAKASEAYLPPDEQRQIIDLAELRAVARECAQVLPFAALGTVALFAWMIP